MTIEEREAKKQEHLRTALLNLFEAREYLRLAAISNPRKKSKEYARTQAMETICDGLHDTLKLMLQ